MQRALQAAATWTVFLVVLSILELSGACFHDLFVTVGKMSRAGKWYIKQEGKTLASGSTVVGSIDSKVLVDILKPFEVIGVSDYGGGWSSTLRIYNKPKSHTDRKRVFLFKGPTRYDKTNSVTKIAKLYGSGFVLVKNERTCAEADYEELDTIQKCAQGAEYLDLADTTPYDLTHRSYVSGCWLFYSTLYFNKNSRSSVSYSCSNYRIGCICGATFAEGYDSTTFSNCVAESRCAATAAELDCVKGYFVSSNNNTCIDRGNQSFTCTPCPMGKYQNASNASSCIMCDSGQYTDTIGQHK